ncbi:MAG: metalloregulator ArsR/SmtB family transcription factor [Clostridia bacterium]|nr:metalloregulator ArsR/SmtB family transcription factor [Clostridia bacterium]
MKFDKDQMNKVEFAISPVLEFATCMFITANAEQYDEFAKEMNLSIDSLLIDIVEESQRKLSKYIKSELTFFMKHQDVKGLPITGPLNGLIFKLAIENSSVASVEELIKIIEKMDENKLIFQMLRDAGRENGGVKPVDFEQEHQIPAGRELIEAVRTQIKIDDAELKEKLIECIQNPIETKTRFCLLLKQFYEQVFKPVENKVLSSIKPYKTKYENLYRRDPQEFVREFFRIDMAKSQKKLMIHLSMFMQMGLLVFLEEGELTPDSIVLGIYSDKRFGSIAVKEQLKKFYKLLSDDKRFELLELLSERPWYVNELAERLGISAPTVSHHLSFFIGLGLVTPNREEHRLYYSLDKGKMKEFFEKTTRLLLKE